MQDDLQNVEDVYPLAPVQSGMLTHLIGSNVARGTYVGQHLLTLEGPLDCQAFRTAWEDVLQGHDALRAAFAWEGLDQPVQAILRSVRLPWRESDLRDLPNAAQTAEIDRIAEAELAEGFVLTEAPLMRLYLAQLAPDRHYLIWTCHHLISDGWSHAALVDETLERYRAAISGREAPDRPHARYRDYLSWIASRDSAADRLFWKTYLAGTSEATALRLPRPNRADRTEADRTSIPLEPDLWTTVAARARDLRITPSTLAMAAWAWVLRVYAGETEVTFGVTTSVRPESIPGIERTAGVFINAQPIGIRIGADETPAEVLHRLHADMLARRPHEHTGLAEIQAQSPFGAGQPLFETLFAFEGFPDPAPADGLRITDTVARDTSEFAFALLVRPGDNGVLEAVFDAKRFSRDAVDILLSQVKSVLGQLAREDLGTMGSLRLGTESDMRWIDEVSVAEHDIGPFLPMSQMVDLRAETSAKSTAVICGAEGLTYGDLAQTSDTLAAAIADLRIGKGDLVAIALPRGPGAIAAALGVMKSGATYVPLDLDYPADRLATILEQAAPAAILMESGEASRFDVPAGTKLLSVPDLLAVPRPAPSVAPAPNDPAYVVFTSGSTGVPKGVVASHANLWASTLARRPFYDEVPEAFLVISSLAFDSSIAGIYWTLCEGGRLVLSEPRLEQDPAGFAECIRRNGVTHLLCLPALWHALLDAMPHGALSTLKTVILAGEALTDTVVGAHKAALPNTRLVNEYGPTEATVWCAAYDATQHVGNAPVPIGGPIPNTSLVLRDLDGNLCPPQVPGEVFVGGKGVTNGYHGRPDLTEAAFVSGPSGRLYRTGDFGRWRPDGVVELLGRRDDQIKIRGHRIELAEVEAALCACAGVQEAAVAVRDEGGRRSLVAALVLSDAGAEIPSRDTLSQRLPEAMIPAEIVAVADFPRLPNGKVDRKRIAKQTGSRTTAGPATEAEIAPYVTEITRIWADVLGREDIRSQDNFFDIGGDSLLSIRVAARARAAGIELVPHDLFDFPTIAELARHLSPEAPQPLPSIVDDTVATANAKASAAPFFMIHGRKRMFMSLSEALAPSHRLGFLFGHWENADLGAYQTIEGMADAARTHLKSFQPEGPYRLGGYSVGGMIATELAQKLRADGEAVELLFLLDPPTTARLAAPSRAGPASEPDVTDATIAVTFGEKLRKHLHLLRHRSPAELPRYAWQRLAGSTQYYVIDPARVATANALRRSPLGIPRAMRHHYVMNVYNDAFRRYLARRYDGRTLIVATRGNVPGGNAPQWWTSVFPNADVHLLEQDHVALQLDADTIGHWGQLLKQALQPP